MTFRGIVQASQLQRGNRFTYVGAFTVYVVESDPLVDDASTKFQAVNEQWGPERDHKPIDIRLPSDLEVELFYAPRDHRFRVDICVAKDGFISDFHVKVADLNIASRGFAETVDVGMLAIGGIIEEHLKRGRG